MDVSLLLRVAGIGLLVTVTCQILSKAGRDEHSLLVTLAGMLLVFLLLVEQLETLLSTIRAVFGL